MRRSFGGNHGGMGGGGGGGGGMLRTVARAVTRAGVGNVQEPLSSSSSSTSTITTTSTRPTAATQQKPNSTNLLSLSSSPSSPISTPFSSHNLPISPTSAIPSWPSFSSSSSSSSHCDEFEWVSVEGVEELDGRAQHGFFDDFVLAPVPSKEEVQTAVSALQQVFDGAAYSQLVRDRYGASSDKDAGDHVTSPMHRALSDGSELDWIEPSLHFCNSRMLQSHGYNRVYDAFHLLQTEPSIQRMVISLSSDKAVWDAVLNNEVVRELKESLCADEENSPSSADENSDGSTAARSILKWIFESTKAKAMVLIEMITNVVNQFLEPPNTAKATKKGEINPIEEKLRSTFLLTIVVLLIVVVTRAHGP